MMGVQETPARLFYDFCLDDHVPFDHLLRGVDRHLALDDLRQSLRPVYSQMDRPSVDPRADDPHADCRLLHGHSVRAPPLRRGSLNLAYPAGSAGSDWMAGFPITRRFSKNRHGRFRESDMLRRLFENVVQRCIAEDLVSAAGFAVDASLIAADANKQRSAPNREWSPDEIKETATRATQEYLATLDDAAFGAASPVTPKFISRSDPAAQWTGAHKGHAFFAYADNYLIDINHGVIVDVEATRAIRQAEVGAARTMLERTETRFGMRPASLAADSAYGSAESLGWLVKQKKIAAEHPGLRQVQPNRWHVLPGRLHFRSSRRPVHLPSGQRAGSIPSDLRDSHSERQHLGRYADLSRQQIGLRHLQAQSAVLPERYRPQDPAGSA